jgi:hypothetical protein
MPTDAHEMVIVPGSAYTVGANRDTDAPADLRNPEHYPVEAECTICHEMVRRDRPQPGRIDWTHTGRKPGDPS